MHLLWELFFVFFKMDIFNFGGGYAMISLMQVELISRQWMTTNQFLDMIAIAQMTPGAFAINAATFVGFELGGILGSIIATLAIPTPTLLLVFLIYPWLERNKQHPRIQVCFYVIRSIVVALIFSAVVSVADSTFLKEGASWGDKSFDVRSSINMSAILIFLIMLVGLIKFKWHPIWVIILSGVISLAWFTVFPQFF